MTTAQSLGGRIGAHRKWANTSDRTAATAPARAAMMAKFERQVDPDGTLPPAERQLRAASARSAHFAELALARHRGAQKRRKSKAA